MHDQPTQCKIVLLSDYLTSALIENHLVYCAGCLEHLSECLQACHARSVPRDASATDVNLQRAFAGCEVYCCQKPANVYIYTATLAGFIFFAMYGLRGELL